MSEFRQNLASKEWVVIAPERGKRPVNTKQVPPRKSVPAYDLRCPFCPGNEVETGEELHRVDDGDAWLIRVVRNKYSALDARNSIMRSRHGRFLAAGSHGHAEVIIETPLHNHTLALMSLPHLEMLMHVWRNRLTELSLMNDISILLLFRNWGPGAGTSIEHPHSQIIASPIIPPHIRDPFQKAMLHYDTWGTCVYCDIVAEEIEQNKRILSLDDYFVAFCPFASSTPFEMRIYPRRHCASFTWINDEELHALPATLSGTLKAMRAVLNNPGYNLILRTAPVGDEDVRYLHWYIVIVPRISTPAGFEMGSGIYINPSAPEQCAEQLRAALSDGND